MQSRQNLGKLASTLEGIPIWGCLPGSVAKKSGIRYGDVLLSMNGRRTRNVDDYIKAREINNKEAAVVVFRNGVECSVRLVFGNTTTPSEDQLRQVAAELSEGRMVPSATSTASEKPRLPDN